MEVKLDLKESAVWSNYSLLLMVGRRGNDIVIDLKYLYLLTFSWNICLWINNNLYSSEMCIIKINYHIYVVVCETIFNFMTYQFYLHPEKESELLSELHMRINYTFLVQLIRYIFDEVITCGWQSAVGVYVTL